ncbi:hypothetical protein HanRHA438_Chr11g0515391 [Helianthus annuus]|nr:hypothetical protein HanIR_Chr11g0541191 [Helianthus annuus]KAJ0518356.1 hypothetical protein HanHA89_Chr11g0436501 [Helianthus annuus]KAJ0686388.1 hypothetical protein HanLR1_Chr11g0414161 [Helianthus annuus]KAJ0690210.1 hypothetical protein HanOQP8_Chr11g0415261 [Helianthus annuus]KAJ0871698.1 hypothetical protein HanRHA438_Chr11g0515391 [Helianthus annuus]
MKFLAPPLGGVNFGVNFSRYYCTITCNRTSHDEGDDSDGADFAGPLHSHQRLNTNV